MSDEAAAVPQLSYGLPCAESSVSKQPELFRSDSGVLKEVHGFVRYIPQLISRPLLWYGEMPHMQLRWLDAIINGTRSPIE